MAKVGYSVSDKMTLDFFGNYDQIKNDYDGGFDDTGTSDTNLNKTSSKQFRFGFSPKFKYDKREFVLNSSFNKLVRSYDELDIYSNSVGFAQYESRSVNIDGFNKYEFSNSFYLVSGLQYQFHDANSVTPYGNIAKESTKFNMIDPYLTGVYTSKVGFNLNAGVRWNSHSAYGNQLVYNINPSFDFQTLPFKIVSSYSTAFVTPSLYQLYSPYGNSGLTPEKNSTAEVGFETQLANKKIRWNVIGFYREQTNFIGFYFNPTTYASNYINIDGLNRAKGIETEIQFALNDKVKWNSNYTFTQVDEALDRLIPKHKFNSSLDYKVADRFFWNINYQYIDARKDAFFDGNTYATTQVKLGSYQLLNSMARYEIRKNKLSVFASVQNIFNVDFVENVGYSALGRNFKLGVNYNW
jgi:vitamin B12 transporter